MYKTLNIKHYIIMIGIHIINYEKIISVKTSRETTRGKKINIKNNLTLDC